METKTLNKSRKSIGNILSSYSFVLIALAIFLAYLVVNGGATTWSGVMNILRHTAVVGIISFGMGLAIITGGIDLSVGAVAALAGMIASIAVTSGVPVPFAIILGILVGAACGAFSGFFVAVTGLPNFITTLGTMQIARGLALLVTKGTPVFGLPASFSIIGGARIGGLIPVAGLIWIALTVIFALILKYTTY